MSEQECGLNPRNEGQLVSCLVAQEYDNCVVVYLLSLLFTGGLLTKASKSWELAKKLGASHLNLTAVIVRYPALSV